MKSSLGLTCVLSSTLFLDAMLYSSWVGVSNKCINLASTVLYICKKSLVAKMGQGMKQLMSSIMAIVYSSSVGLWEVRIAGVSSN